MNTKPRWQEWINMALGLWLFVSPLFGFGGNSAAVLNAHVFGAIIVVLSGAALFFSQVWEEWINMAIGIWLFVAPFALGFSDMHKVLLNHIDVGTALFGIALWAATMYPVNSRGEHISHVHKV